MELDGRLPLGWMTHGGSGGDAAPVRVMLRACTLHFPCGTATAHQRRALLEESQVLWGMTVCCAHEKYLENIWP